MPVPLYQAKAEFFRTLGHPARIRVLELLSERDHAVHELLAAIEIEPSNLSQQLAVLRRAGLVAQRREGAEAERRSQHLPPPHGASRAGSGRIAITRWRLAWINGAQRSSLAWMATQSRHWKHSS